jgi:hypothetical protein
MEDWKVLLYKHMDESENPKQVDKVAHKLFRYLATTKIKDSHKFSQRMGREFEKCVEELDNEPIAKDLLWDDEFFELTINLCKKYTSKTNQSKD